MGDVLIVLMMMIQRVARGDLPAKITATNLSPHTTVYYMIAPIRACELAGLADAAFRSNTLQTCANLNTYCPPRQQGRVEHPNLSNISSDQKTPLVFDSGHTVHRTPTACLISTHAYIIQTDRQKTRKVPSLNSVPENKGTRKTDRSIT